jgi:GT2 family glycosyltransferase
MMKLPRGAERLIRVSVVIPVHNGVSDLRHALAALAASTVTPFECVVVDDGSEMDPEPVTSSFRCRLIRTGVRRGPGFARNLGASFCSGNVLLFIDSDVRVRPDTVQRVMRRFTEDPELATLIGSYDNTPAHPSFLSQYRNLLHTWTHQTASEQASTFWGACGAIRADVFRQCGGFRATCAHPSTEDIELGYRLKAMGFRMALDHELTVTHGKRWTLGRMVRTDVFDRAVPWTELILSRQRFPDDLNISRRRRVSLILVWLAALLGSLAIVRHGFSPAIAAIGALLVSIVLDFSFYRFLARCRGPLFALASMPLYVLFQFCSGVGFALGCARWALRRERAEPVVEVTSDREECRVAAGPTAK